MKEATQKSLDALSKGINAELAAYVFYKRAGEHIKHKELAKLLTDLAVEEKDHYWILETEYDSLVRSEKWVTYNDIMRKKGLPEIPEEMTEPHRKRIETVEKTDDPMIILNVAIQLETDARDFYQSLIEAETDPLAKEMYIFLSKFEQGHVNILTSWQSKIK
jgi:rubrerythrin